MLKIRFFTTFPYFEAHSINFYTYITSIAQDGQAEDRRVRLLPSIWCFSPRKIINYRWRQYYLLNYRQLLIVAVERSSNVICWAGARCGPSHKYWSVSSLSHSAFRPRQHRRPTQGRHALFVERGAGGSQGRICPPGTLSADCAASLCWLLRSWYGCHKCMICLNSLLPKKSKRAQKWPLFSRQFLRRG